MADDDLLREAREAFDRCEEAELQNRKDAKADIKFARLSQQWPDAVRTQREKEGRPCLTINKLAPVIRQVVNDARQNRPSIKVMPADSKADPETAELISGLIRNIEQTSNADVAYDTGIDQAVSGGFGYWGVNLAYSNLLDPGTDLASIDPEQAKRLTEQDIVIERKSNQFAIYGDPDSTEADSSDWMVAFEVEKMRPGEFKRKWPKAKMTDFTSAEWGECSPKWRTEDEVMVARWWKREEVVKMAIGIQLPDSEDAPGDLVVMFVDEWKKQQAEIEAQGGVAATAPFPTKGYKVTRRTITGIEILETDEWPGCYIPIVPIYGDEVNVEGKRYFRSLIRDAKDANQMFNYWRTTATETVALAPRMPYIGPKGAFKTDAAKWNTANSASHAFLEYDGTTPPQRQPMPSVAAGAIQEAINAADDIKAITGIYDASLGARSNETSGRAIMARQREGDVSTFHFIDNETRAIRHTGKILIDLIPKVYSTPRMVRILGEDKKAENKPINGMQMQDMNGEDSEDMADIRIHDLRVGKYDLVVTSGPGFTTRREEAATQMMEVIRGNPELAEVIGDIMARNLDWPGAEEIAKRLEANYKAKFPDPEGGDGIAPEIKAQMDQMAAALQEMGQKLQEAESKSDIEAQKVAIDAYKAAIDAYKAETERMTALAPAFGPNEIQAVVTQTLQQLMTPNDLPQEGETTGMDLAA